MVKQQFVLVLELGYIQRSLAYYLLNPYGFRGGDTGHPHETAISRLAATHRLITVLVNTCKYGFYRYFISLL